MPVLIAFGIVGPCFHGGFEHLIRAGFVGGIHDLSHTVEHEGYGIGFTQRSAAFGEIGSNIPHRARAVVGQCFNDDGNAAGAIAFIAHILVIIGISGPHGAIDGAFDPVIGHIHGAAGGYGGAQTRVVPRFRPAQLGGHDNLAPYFRENLGPLGVLCAFAVLNVLKLGMASHL